MSTVGTVGVSPASGFGALKNSLAKDAEAAQAEAEEHAGFEYVVHFKNGASRSILCADPDLSSIVHDLAEARKRNAYINWSDTQASAASEVDHIDAVLEVEEGDEAQPVATPVAEAQASE